MAKEQVVIRVIQTAGATDYASEVEANLIGAHIGLFHVQPFKAGSRSRAELELVRASDPRTLYRALMSPGADLIHLISHGSATVLQCGLSNVTPTMIQKEVPSNTLNDVTIVSTACHLGEQLWRDLFVNHLGANALVASENALSFRDTAVFSTSFYNAYLGQTHRSHNQRVRAWRAYRLAYGCYRSCISNKNERTKIDFFPSAGLPGNKLTNTISLR